MLSKHPHDSYRQASLETLLREGGFPGILA